MPSSLRTNPTSAFPSASVAEGRRYVSNHTLGDSVDSAAPGFEISESPVGEYTLLRLLGELDLASAPVMTQRLAQLRDELRPVRLDLSDLRFIDSSGIHLLMSAFDDAHESGWRLEIDPHLSKQVHRLFNLVGVRTTEDRQSGLMVHQPT